MSERGPNEPAARPPSEGLADEPRTDAFGAVVAAIDAWVSRFDRWSPMHAVSDDWNDVGARLAGVGEDLARVLVVGVLGGTGTGKSTLVNALAGEEVSPAGDVSRPTTTNPVVVTAEGTDCSWLPLTEWRARVVRTDAPAIAGIVLVDCPDPDTQGPEPSSQETVARGLGSDENDHGPATDPRNGASDRNRNRDVLESVLPSCDVLLLVSTAQKYRSWAVAREVVRFAPGRPVMFVQTHASRDPDIREDWTRELLREGFDVPFIHRLDALEATDRARAGLPPEAGFAGLCEAIRSQLAGRAAVRVRRTGAMDLLQWFVRRASSRFGRLRDPVAAFRVGITHERMRLEGVLASGLTRQLMASRRQWQRLLGCEMAGEGRRGPFGAFLGIIDRLLAIWPGLSVSGGGLVARVLAAQPIVSGDVFQSPPNVVRDDTAGPGMAAIQEIGLGQADVDQSRSILVGLAARAEIEEPLVGRARLPDGRVGAIVSEVLSRTARWLEAGIAGLVETRRGRIGTMVTRWILEIAFCGFVLVVVGRAAWGFFHDRLWAGQPATGGGLLWESIPWIVLWGLSLRWLAGICIRRGLETDVRALVADIPRAGMVDPILEDFSTAANEAASALAEFESIEQRSTRLSDAFGGSLHGLGRLRREPEVPFEPRVTQ